MALLIGAAIVACRETAAPALEASGAGEAARSAASTRTPPGDTGAELTQTPTTVAPPAGTVTPETTETPRLATQLPTPLTSDSGTPLAGTPHSGGSSAAQTPALPPDVTTPFAKAPPLMTIQEWEAIAFKYVSDKYKVPVNELQSASVVQRELPITKVILMQGTVSKLRNGVMAWVIAIDQAKKVYEYQGIGALEEADRAAQRQKYGKLEPRLYDVLQSKGPDDMVLVSIWVRSRSEQDIWIEIARRHPEARLDPYGRATENTPPGYWLDVIFPEFSAEVKKEVGIATRPLLEYLRSLGYETGTPAGFPSFRSRLPKRIILEIEKRADVTAIWWVSEQARGSLDTAVPASGAPTNWAVALDGLDRRVTGEGVYIGIVDEGTVDFTNPFVSRGEIVGNELIKDHTTMVAGAAASDHPKYRGPAYKSRFKTASITMWGSYENATQPVIDAGARLINLSWGEPSPYFRAEDVYYDYLAKNRRITFIATSGNWIDLPVESPGKGFNVITVGGFEDSDSVQWNWDKMWKEADPSAEGSSWYNPIDQQNEKPDVVAPAKVYSTAIKGGALDTNPQDWITDKAQAGTSFAVPQVIGGVAMLFQKDSSLASRPEAVKAILMATAIHNVESDPDLKTPDSYGSRDLKDGAGAVDLAEAYKVVSAGSFRDLVLLMPTPHFPDGWYVSSWNVQVGRNQRLRVALAWQSYVEPTSSPQIDHLRTNLNLYLYRLSDQGQEIGDPVATSLSSTNNVELIDYSTSNAGYYRIKIRREPTAPDEVTNNVGLAWWVGNRYYAGNSIIQEQRSSDLAILQGVGLDSFSEPRVASSLGNEVTVPGEPRLLSYSARATYTGLDPSYASYRHPSWPPDYQPDPPYSSRHPIAIYGVEPGSGPFADYPQQQTNNNAEKAWASFAHLDVNISSTTPPLKVARPGVTLNGDRRQAYDLYQYFESITAPGVSPPEPISPQTAHYREFQSGDAWEDFRKNGTDSADDVDAVDALIIAQYLADLRPLDHLNAVNAASVRHDNILPPYNYDRITIADSMFIAQMLANLRDDFYELLPSSPGSYSTKVGVQATVEAGALQLAPNGTGRVPIVLKNVTGTAGVGAYDIRITYDPKVIKVTSVAGGAAPFDKVAAYKIDANKGVVRLNGFHAVVPGLTRDEAIAYLNVSPVAAAGRSTNIQITVTTLSDVVGNDVASRVVHGNVAIK